MPFANEHLAHGTATDTRLDQGGNVCDIDAVSGRRLTVDLDHDLRQRRPFIDQHVGRAGHSLEDLGNFLGNPAHLVEIVAEYLQRKLAVRIEYLVEDAVDDRLTEGDLVTWKLRQPCRHAPHE